MESDNYQSTKPIEVNQWIRKFTLLIMPPYIGFVTRALSWARQTVMSWDRSCMLHPTTAKNINKRMHHSCRWHTHLKNVISQHARATDWSAVTYQDRGHCNVSEISMLLSESKTDRLDIGILKFYTDETAITGIREFLSPGVSSIAVSAIFNEFAFSGKWPESWEIDRFDNAAWPILFFAGATRSPIDGRHYNRSLYVTPKLYRANARRR